ncbi:MAG: PspC domain-containing protein [Candidatus Woesearchaeota archaeon]
MMNLFIGLPLIGLAIFLAIAALVVWIWALIDCLKSDSSGEYKLIWLLIIIFMNVFGAILYFVFAKEFNKDRKLSFNGKRGKYLTRSSDNKIIGGVCGGIAEHFSFDPAIIRILWVIFTIFVNGVGILLYLIAWVAIPRDKEIKSDGVEESNKFKGKKGKVNQTGVGASKEHVKPRRRRSILLAVFLSLFVFVLLISFVVFFVILGNLKYNDSVERVSIKSLIVDVKSEVSEKFVVDEIMTSHNYKNFNGFDLTLIEVIEPLDDSCTLFERDPYGIRIYDSGCREFHHRFFVESPVINGYDVHTLVSGGRILKMTFTSFTNVSQEDLITEPIETEVSVDVFECLPEDRVADFCIELYDPVCGFKDAHSFNLGGSTFSNSCFACQNPNIYYYVLGEC